MPYSKQFQVQSLVAKNIPPYTGVQLDLRKEFDTPDGKRSMRIITYQAYNCMGLIGSEHNGVAVLDDGRKQVVADELARQGSGYFGASKEQVELAEKLAGPDMTWDDFCLAVGLSGTCRPGNGVKEHATELCRREADKLWDEMQDTPQWEKALLAVSKAQEFSEEAAADIWVAAYREVYEGMYSPERWAAIEEFVAEHALAAVT